MHDGYTRDNITQLRPGKNRLNPFIPYHFLHESEPCLSGGIETVNTIFLTGKECAFTCLMCDLWKNTLDEPIPKGAIIQQIEYALQRLPKAEVLKLYNNGNFFDSKSIPPSDYAQIIALAQGYKRLIVENHPKLCNQLCIELKELFPGKLEIAIGLETIHPEVLPRLNKQITAEDFRKAAQYLNQHKIDVRAFVLLNPPYITNQRENIEWTVKSVQYAFESGAARCSVIPVRPGNGIMEMLQEQQLYTPPSLDMLEETFEKTLLLQQGQIFVDTWEIGFLSNCAVCFEQRKKRLERMNLSQQMEVPVSCHCKKS